MSSIPGLGKYPEEGHGTSSKGLPRFLFPLVFTLDTWDVCDLPSHAGVWQTHGQAYTHTHASLGLKGRQTQPLQFKSEICLRPGADPGRSVLVCFQR